jgi:hypothetical protein
VALAWYYAIANWPTGTRLPSLDFSRGPMKVRIESSDAAFDDLLDVLHRAEAVADRRVSSSANALLAEIEKLIPQASRVAAMRERA